jgi:alkane 1-monooxygenase
MLYLVLPLLFSLSPLLAWGSGYLALTGLLAAICLPLLEIVIGSRSAAPSPRWGAQFPRLLMIVVISVCFGLAVAADSMPWTALFALSLSCGYVMGGIGIVLAHELGHRRALIDRALSRLLLLSIGFGHYAIEHNRGHHRHAATREDPATARKEEGFWTFLPRYLVGILRDSIRLSREQKIIINEALALIALSTMLFISLFYFLGVKVGTFCILQSTVAILLVAAIDYVEHWGLVREEINGKPERIGPQHTWDCANYCSDLMLFNLPRHASHHLEPSLNCDALYRSSESPQMPLGYAGMALLAMIPPLFKYVMSPRLPRSS